MRVTVDVVEDAGLCPDCGGPAVFSWMGIGYCKKHHAERSALGAPVIKFVILCYRCGRTVPVGKGHLCR